MRDTCWDQNNKFVPRRVVEWTHPRCRDIDFDKTRHAIGLKLELKCSACDKREVRKAKKGEDEWVWK
jgi:hypothetical protein